MKKSVWYVAHIVHVRTPYVYTPRLFITDVPEGTSKSYLWELIDEYEEFGEFGVLHANHCLCPLDKDSPPSVKRAWRGQDDDIYSYPVPRVSYDELKKLKETI